MAVSKNPGMKPPPSAKGMKKGLKTVMKNNIFALAQETAANSPMKKSLRPGMKTGMKAPMEKSAFNNFEETGYTSLVFTPLLQ